METVQCCRRILTFWQRDSLVRATGERWSNWYSVCRREELGCTAALLHCTAVSDFSVVDLRFAKIDTFLRAPLLHEVSGSHGGADRGRVAGLVVRLVRTLGIGKKVREGTPYCLWDKSKDRSCKV